MTLLQIPLLVEGRTYKTASLGTQVWLAENLETTKYNDGTSIPLSENFEEWRILTSPGYYFFSWIGLPAGSFWIVIDHVDIHNPSLSYKVITLDKGCADCTERGTISAPDFWIEDDK